MSTTISCEQNNDVDDSDLQITITNVPPPDDERKNRESISLWRRFLQGKPPSDVDPRDWPPTKKYAIILIVALSAFTAPCASAIYVRHHCYVYRAITDHQPM
ncbi:predicted protein [Lichtheimia corymbifera JMRC:FSU:9682]|uniref:Uncharacterized protein n=1 Tax=Lichtheimia corymbifera JMRC:FSU:9682 TaxID=1263082 RepID=A0A068S2N3_9FUNG|nr:predicted protein [Lichtheimia corymbifera JMRC:FSU:9682]